MKTKALSREDRKRQIMLVFAIELQSGRDAKMTLADIARVMRLSASTKLRDMVTELMIEGLVVAETEPIPGIAGFRRIYSPSALVDQNTGKRKHESRTIQIKTSRKGQLAIWDEVIS